MNLLYFLLGFCVGLLTMLVLIHAALREGPRF